MRRVRRSCVYFTPTLKQKVPLRKFQLTLCLALALFLLAPFSTAAQQPRSDTVGRVKRAVVILTTYDTTGNPLLQGSGFFVSPDRIVTAAHVIKDARAARIRAFDGRTYTVQGILAINEARDLVLLQTSATMPEGSALKIAQSSPFDGEKIFVVSNPQGYAWKTSRGTVIETWDFQGLGQLLSISASIMPGSSGGPVVNLEGEVVGVADMHIVSGEEFNLAVPGVSLKTLLPGTLQPLEGFTAQRRDEGGGMRDERKD